MLPTQYVERPKTPSFETTNITAVTDTDLKLRSPFEVHHQYINGLSEPITVVDRSGVRVTIPPSTPRFGRDFIVRVSITYTKEVNVNIDRVSHGRSPASQVLMEVLSGGIVNHRGNTLTHRLDYHVEASDIERNGGNIYLTNLDVVLSNWNPARPDLIPDHPCSNAGVRNAMIENDPAINNVGAFGYGIRIVDPVGRYGDRYININNRVYRVPVIRDSSIQDGVYVTSSGTTEYSGGYARPESKRYDFEEADEALGLYGSVEAAKTLGDVNAQRERELEEFKLNVKRENEQLKAEKQRRDAEYEEFRRNLEKDRQDEEARVQREERRLKERETRLKEEMAELEHRRTLRTIERKDTYEERSHNRKDTSEMVKFLPAVFTGLLALFVAVQKVTTR